MPEASRATRWIGGYFFLALFALGILLYGTEQRDAFYVVLTYGLPALMVLGLFSRRLTLGARDLHALLIVAVGLRLLAFFALPALSDDFYRFIWDGILVNAGLDPYSLLPSEIGPAQRTAYGLPDQLFSRLNSPDYYSVYPPPLQLIFAGATALSDTVYGQVLGMKLPILAAEFGSLFLLVWFTRRWQLSWKNFAVYALHPLPIVELVGNLHYEGLVIFFLLVTLALLDLQKGKLATLTFAGAVAVKLLPLMLLPSLFFRKGTSPNRLLFPVVSAGVVGAAFAPALINGSLGNFLNSTRLYFSHFEFNGSLYAVFSAIGAGIIGYNPIQYVGPALAIAAGVVVLWLAFRYRSAQSTQLATVWLLSHATYFLFATTVHPWYLCPLLALAVLTEWRFAVVWASLIPFTYLSYGSVPDILLVLIVTGEYLAVVFTFYREWRENKTFARGVG